MSSTIVPQLAACAVHVRGLPGGGLQGRSAIQVVISVSDTDGEPIAGLPATAFALTPIPTGARPSTPAPHARAITDFREVASGVYTLTTDSHGLTQVMLLTVADNSRGTARTLLRVDA